MKRNIWVFGTIAGVISSFWMALGLTTNSTQMIENGQIYGYTIMIIAFSMIFVGVKNYRDKTGNGTITFGRAFKMGLFMTLIASTIYVIAWAIDYNFFASDFMDKYAEHMMQTAQEKGMSQAELDKTVADINYYKEMYKNPLFFTLITYCEIIPPGLIISLIAAVILKKKPEPQAV